MPQKNRVENTVKLAESWSSWLMACLFYCPCSTNWSIFTFNSQVMNLPLMRQWFINCLWDQPSQFPGLMSLSLQQVWCMYPWLNHCPWWWYNFPQYTPIPQTQSTRHATPQKTPLLEAPRHSNSHPRYNQQYSVPKTLGLTPTPTLKENFWKCP